MSELVLPWEFAAVMEDSRMSAKPQQWKFSWSQKLGNEAAHWLASVHLDRNSSHVSGMNEVGPETHLSYTIKLC